MKNFNKNRTKQFLKLAVVLLFVTFSGNLYAQQTTAEETVAAKIKQEALPTLAEIVPQSALLTDKLATLNNSIDDLVDVKAIDENYKKIAQSLKAISVEFNKYKKDGNVGTNELDNLKSELNQSGQKFDDSNKTLKDAIELLEDSRKEWLGYKNKWANYEIALSNEDLPTEAKKSLKKASVTIEKGLSVIGSKLNVLIKLQQRGYTNQSVINDLNTQILILKQKKITSAFEDGSIPMYSPKFYQQFDGKLWGNIKRGFKNVIIPSKSYFENNWWIYVFQIFISIFIIYIIRKNAAFIKKQTSFDYISERAISAGIFFGFLSILIFHSDMKSVPLLNLLSFLIGGISFCILISNRKVEQWKNKFYYILVAILALTGIFHVFNLPIVLFRIFIVGVSIYGIYRLHGWYKKNKHITEFRGYKWLFFSLFVYLWIIVISEIIGKEVLALYMYESLIKSVTLIVFTVVFLNMIQAGIEVTFKVISNGDINNIEIDEDNSELLDKSVQSLSKFIGVIVFLLGVIPRLLVFWNIYSDAPEAYNKLLGIGFSIGENHFSLGILITSISILYGCYMASTIIEMLLMNDRFDKKLDKGARLSIAQLIRYFLMFFGFLIAISVLGFNLTNFTIVLSALGVGIGFGLQGVVNNFVSGLILLFERPIREGDTVEIDGDWSLVKKIGLRSTTVQTFNQSDIIIPNADLVYNKVTNWTLNNNRKRIIIAVGVAYGSDIEEVIHILKDIGSTSEGLVKSVKPVVLFRDFAESTLNFELRVRAKDQGNALTVESDLRAKINMRFSEHNIVIAFPQRDLYIKSIEGSVFNDNTKETKNTETITKTSKAKQVVPKAIKPVSKTKKEDTSSDKK